MVSAKDITLKVIPSDIANRFVVKHHYSGKYVSKSQLHFGAFLDGKLHGVLSYGPSMDKSKLIGLVAGTGWNEFIELNRMAFDDVLPRNSESRCISLSIRMIKKYAPQIKWIVSFSDGCSCGDGTIYRASNFVLTQIEENRKICVLPSGEKLHKIAVECQPNSPRRELGGISYYEATGGRYNFGAYVRAANAKILNGYQLRYLYFIDPTCRERLTCSIIPFSKIDELGAGMYKGEKISLEARRG